MRVALEGQIRLGIFLFVNKKLQKKGEILLAKMAVLDQNFLNGLICVKFCYYSIVNTMSHTYYDFFFAKQNWNKIELRI